MRRFTNRKEAGRELASMLHDYADRTDVIVVALPRGGVPVAYEVARRLGAPLDAFTVQKVGLPENEEYAMGAITTGGISVIDRALPATLRITDAEVDALFGRAHDEVVRREQLYRRGHKAPNVAAKQVIVVDDGLATGATMTAAVTALRTLEPEKIVVAVPVASREAERAVRAVADVFVCACLPVEFYSVGQWYDDFSQTPDAEVLDLLNRAESQMLERRAAHSGSGAWYA
jgi:predicted phosphoribosyltransferase